MVDIEKGNNLVEEMISFYEYLYDVYQCLILLDSNKGISSSEYQSYLEMIRKDLAIERKFFADLYYKGQNLDIDNIVAVQRKIISVLKPKDEPLDFRIRDYEMLGNDELVIASRAINQNSLHFFNAFYGTNEPLSLVYDEDQIADDYATFIIIQHVHYLILSLIDNVERKDLDINDLIIKYQICFTIPSLEQSLLFNAITTAPLTNIFADLLLNTVLVTYVNDFIDYLKKAVLQNSYFDKIYLKYIKYFIEAILIIVGKLQADNIVLNIRQLLSEIKSDNNRTYLDDIKTTLNEILIWYEENKTTILLKRTSEIPFA